MSRLLDEIKHLVRSGDFRVSDHARARLATAAVREEEAVAGLADATVVEEYPDYPKGPCMLVLQHDDDELAYHALWGTPLGHDRPAVLITTYRPDPSRWSPDFTQRR